MPAEVAPDHHFNLERFAKMPYGNHGIGHRDHPVRHNILSSLKKFCGNLVQHLSLIGYSLRKDHVKSGNPVADDHDQEFSIDVVHIADLPLVIALLLWKAV